MIVVDRGSKDTNSYFLRRIYTENNIAAKLRCSRQQCTMLSSNLMLMARIREREKNVLFNDALNTFYLRLYGVRHIVRDHSDSEKGNPLPPHRLLLSINSKGSFICTIPQIR